MTQMNGPIVDAVRIVLMTHWNPIGPGVPNDEYDSYIPSIIHLMKVKVGAQELATHLQRIETEEMGLEPSAERNFCVAQMLKSIPT